MSRSHPLSSSPIAYPCNQQGLTDSLNARIMAQEKRLAYDRLEIKTSPSGKSSVTEPSSPSPAPRSARRRSTLSLAERKAAKRRSVEAKLHNIRITLRKVVKAEHRGHGVRKMEPTIVRTITEEMILKHQTDINKDTTGPWQTQVMAFYDRHLPINSSGHPFTLGTPGGIHHSPSAEDLQLDLEALSDGRVLWQFVVFFDQEIWQAAFRVYDPWKASQTLLLEDRETRVVTELKKRTAAFDLCSPILVLPSYDPRLDDIPIPKWYQDWESRHGQRGGHEIQSRGRTDTYYYLDSFLPKSGPISEELLELAEWLRDRQKDWAPIFIDSSVQKKYLAISEDEEFLEFKVDEPHGFSFDTPRHIRQRTLDHCQFAAGLGRPSMAARGYLEKSLRERMLEARNIYRTALGMDSSLEID
ncbi:hypothetical protein SISSUDRAFT_1132333 [Sistotremastrum suecicum HHB10207 ss-3]|uniref:Uncharacterized protein n=1 Tax=Sistotremastrum suecicum HHB10207 ss-3 TaxID=1314776 RepID=A0A165YZ56_9AGAM|nr:hypothetical protein SISSUDRAFT_1132333 [Sistotremastrum suecicum HHB10207 ss-3]